MSEKSKWPRVLLKFALMVFFSLLLASVSFYYGARVGESEKMVDIDLQISAASTRWIGSDKEVEHDNFLNLLTEFCNLTIDPYVCLGIGEGYYHKGYPCVGYDWLSVGLSSFRKYFKSKGRSDEKINEIIQPFMLIFNNARNECSTIPK